jgi:protein-S-isoprenylcysteine O-methyltransferase Ste14
LTLQFLQLAGWLLCIPYSSIPLFWLLIHPWAEDWRSRQSSPYRILLPLWMAIWVLLGLITFHFRHIVLYSSPWSWVPAILLFATGFWLYSQSSKGFSAKQLGGMPEVIAGHREQRLVTTGIRTRVRHPVYLAHLCEMLAWSIGTGLAVCYGLTAFAAVTGAVMIRLEDAELEQRFGKEYRQYRAQVPAVVPKLGK